MVSKAKSRGSCSTRFIGFLLVVVLGFFFMGQLLQCAQQIPRMAANAVDHAASGVGNAAGHTVTGWGQSLWNGIKKVFGFARDQWANADPAGKFDLVCEHVPVEGVDKLCPYFTSALQGASNAQTARIACYWHAAATGPNPQQTLQRINQACPKTANNPSDLETCLSQYVEPGDASSCLSTSPDQLWAELHTMIEPVACPFGIKYLCTTQSSSASTASASSSVTRTDVNYLNCLQRYYLDRGVQAVIGASCGTRVTAGNAECVKTQLQPFTYGGQNLGQQYIQQCNAQPVQ
jgi:hypothetical protein